MKNIYLFLSVLIIASLACDVSVNLTPSTGTDPTPIPTFTNVPVSNPPTQIPPSDTTVPATALPSATPIVQPSPVTNTLVTFGHLSLEIPSSIASGASGSDMPAVTNEDGPYWDKTPGHLQVSLNDDYVLQGKLHKAQIYVYPATEYAVLSPAAFESMHRLRNIMSGVVSVTPDQLPAVPFFNAAQVFVSNIQDISFQTGSGIRFVTEYGQYPAPVNNQELFYHFQGFSDEGDYYIVAIFPITAPGLSDRSDPAYAPAIGGVAYPNMGDPNANWEGYYGAAADLLNATPPDAFTPSLNQLDALIQSMWITP
jgi:hypothetical protein